VSHLKCPQGAGRSGAQYWSDFGDNFIIKTIKPFEMDSLRTDKRSTLLADMLDHIRNDAARFEVTGDAPDEYLRDSTFSLASSGPLSGEGSGPSGASMQKKYSQQKYSRGVPRRRQEPHSEIASNLNHQNLLESHLLEIESNHDVGNVLGFPQSFSTPRHTPRHPRHSRFPDELATPRLLHEKLEHASTPRKALNSKSSNSKSPNSKSPNSKSPINSKSSNIKSPRSSLQSQRSRLQPPKPPESLLPRFLFLFKVRNCPQFIDDDSKANYFAVMPNIKRGIPNNRVGFEGRRVIELDLKGSWATRSKGKDQEFWNFGAPLVLPGEQYRELRETLRRDIGFLVNRNLMDYSLLLIVENVESDVEKGRGSGQEARELHGEREIRVSGREHVNIPQRDRGNRKAQGIRTYLTSLPQGLSGLGLSPNFPSQEFNRNLDNRSSLNNHFSHLNFDPSPANGDVSNSLIPPTAPSQPPSRPVRVTLGLIDVLQPFGLLKGLESKYSRAFNLYRDDPKLI
jgi:hypothetical protein